MKLAQRIHEKINSFLHNERGETVPGALITVIISSIILLGLAGVIQTVLGGRVEAERTTDVQIVATNIDTTLRKDIQAAAKIVPIGVTNGPSNLANYKQVAFHIPAIQGSECKVVTWTINGNSIERNLAVYTGTVSEAFTGNISCDTSSTLIVDANKEIANTVYSIDGLGETVFTYKNQVGRLLYIELASGVTQIAGEPDTNNPYTDDPRSFVLWNDLEPAQVSLPFAITHPDAPTVTRDTTQRSLIVSTPPAGEQVAEAERILDGEYGHVTPPTGLNAPTHMILNQNYPITWDANSGLCPADNPATGTYFHKRYNLYRDNLLIASTTGDSYTDSLPDGTYLNKGDASYELVTSCLKGSLELTSTPITDTAVSQIPTPAQPTVTTNLATNPNNDQTRLDWVGICPVGTFPMYNYRVEALHSSAVGPAHTNIQNTWVNTTNLLHPTGWGASYEATVGVKCVNDNPVGAVDSPASTRTIFFANAFTTNPTLTLSPSVSSLQVGNSVDLNRTLTCNPNQNNWGLHTFTYPPITNIAADTSPWRGETPTQLNNSSGNATGATINTGAKTVTQPVLHYNGGSRTFTVSAECEVNGFTSPTVNASATVEWTLPTPPPPASITVSGNAPSSANWTATVNPAASLLPSEAVATLQYQTRVQVGSNAWGAWSGFSTSNTRVAHNAYSSFGVEGRMQYQTTDPFVGVYSSATGPVRATSFGSWPTNFSASGSVPTQTRGLTYGSASITVSGSCPNSPGATIHNTGTWTVSYTGSGAGPYTRTYGSNGSTETRQVRCSVVSEGITTYSPWVYVSGRTTINWTMPAPVIGGGAGFLFTSNRYDATYCPPGATGRVTNVWGVSYATGYTGDIWVRTHEGVSQWFDSFSSIPGQLYPSNSNSRTITALTYSSIQVILEFTNEAHLYNQLSRTFAVGILSYDPMGNPLITGC